MFSPIEFVIEKAFSNQLSALSQCVRFAYGFFENSKKRARSAHQKS